ncbi:MAG: hemerythrin domain-containing protein [bacterium]
MAQIKSKIAQQVEKDHDLLRQDIGDLKITFWEEVLPEDFSNWRLECIWQLRDFKNRLLKHFDLEEEGGFMQDVLNVAPQAERQVQQLKAEHEQISAQLDEVLAELKEMPEKDAKSLDTIRTKLNDIMNTIRKHENEEHKLLQKAYYREYGGPA